MITLLTDFGTSDPYVGIMKGVMLSQAPDAVIVDITHDIAPQDIYGAAFCLSSAYRYFPAKSIHVVVVDPGVGGRRSIIAVSMAGHCFLAPDNGVLSLILGSGQIETIVKVENPDYFRHPVSRTFHGRDIFAPVAAHLNNGLPPGRLGPEIRPEQAIRLNLPVPDVSARRKIRGQVIRVDHFGNLITNIDAKLMNQTFGSADRRDLTITIGGHRINGLSGCYGDVAPQSLAAVIGSTGFVEISVNFGNASKYCGASIGGEVLIEDGAT